MLAGDAALRLHGDRPGSHGEVGPVGGLTHKIIAAARAGRKHVVIPATQANALADLPADVKAAVEVHPVATAREAVALALVEA